jgi:putative flippase GtrA
MRSSGPEILRYALNGIIATLVHFAALTILLELLKVNSAGLSNLIASALGISVSFLGSRYYVFQNREGQFFDHATKFLILYGGIALYNGLFLMVWTDLLHHDYRFGFMIATALQVVLSYFGNSFFVFSIMSQTAIKIIRALLGTLLFASLFVLLHFVHFRHFPVNVVFYAAIGDALAAAVMGGVILVLLPYFRPLGGFEKGQLMLIWILAGYGFAISIPTVIDRSLSFYILEKIQQRGGGILKDHMRQVFVEEYLPEHRLVDVRLTEQLESGTIAIEHGCVKLTSKGQRIASFGRFYRQSFLPKKRLLMGEYSDDLTNPFRHSATNPGYTCE